MLLGYPVLVHLYHVDADQERPNDFCISICRVFRLRVLESCDGLDLSRWCYIHASCDCDRPNGGCIACKRPSSLPLCLNAGWPLLSAAKQLTPTFRPRSDALAHTSLFLHRTVMVPRDSAQHSQESTINCSSTPARGVSALCLVPPRDIRLWDVSTLANGGRAVPRKLSGSWEGVGAVPRRSDVRSGTQRGGLW